MTQENKESSFRFATEAQRSGKKEEKGCKKGGPYFLCKARHPKRPSSSSSSEVQIPFRFCAQRKKKKRKGKPKQGTTSDLRHPSLLSLFLARKTHFDFPPKELISSPVTKSLSFLSPYYIAGAVLPSRVIGFETGKSFGRSTGTGETLILQCLASSIGIGQHCLDSQTHVAFP